MPHVYRDSNLEKHTGVNKEGCKQRVKKYDKSSAAGRIDYHGTADKVHR